MTVHQQVRRLFLFVVVALSLGISAVVATLAVSARPRSGDLSQTVGKAAATREQFTAFAINMGVAPGVPAPRTGAASTVEITIERWSTAAERQTLVDGFRQKGPDGLLRALQKAKRAGYIRLPNTLGYDLHYTRQVPAEDGGRRIVIATDRRIGFWEARNQPRTVDYPFTLIEMRLNENDEGEGKLALATKIALSKDEQHVELENYGSEPIRLNAIHRSR